MCVCGGGGGGGGGGWGGAKEWLSYLGNVCVCVARWEIHVCFASMNKYM